MKKGKLQVGTLTEISYIFKFPECQIPPYDSGIDIWAAI